MSCKWDRDQETYLRDSEPCRHDDYGDPTKHCTARRNCGNHIGPRELTCARCIGRTRQDIRAIVLRSAELLPEALHAGVDSEVANLAGPAADYRVFSARRLLDKQWISENIPERHQERAMRNLLPDDDEQHPYVVTTRWQLMISEDYGHPTEDTLSISAAAAYLERTLPRLAQDDEQDFPLFAREIRKCRSHLEAVLRDSLSPERGAPCPMCAQPAPRLQRERGHYCTDPDCDQQFHYSTVRDDDTGEDVPDLSGDRWVCPRDRGHVWGEYDYRKWVADVYEATRSA